MAVPTDFIVHYTMEAVANGQVQDETATHHATINSGSAVAGMVGQAWSFPGGSMGSNTYNAGLHLDGSVMRDKDQFTASFLAKGAGVVIQTDWYTDTGGWETGWGFTVSDTLVRFRKALSSTSMKQVAGDAGHDTNSWLHYVVVVDHAGEVVIYQNGLEVLRGDISGARYYDGDSYANTGENIGAAYSGSYNGEIDEFKVFPRLLSGAEATELYQDLFEVGQYEDEVLADSPSAYFKLAGAVTDETGTATGQTLTGAASFSDLALNSAANALRIPWEVGSAFDTSLAVDTGRIGLELVARIEASESDGTYTLATTASDDQGAPVVELAYDHPNRQLRFTGYSDTAGTVAFERVGTVTLLEDHDNHIVAQWDATSLNTPELYVNGQAIGTGVAATDTLMASTDSLKIGGPTAPLVGLVAHVALYPAPLSAARAEAHHTAALLVSPPDGILGNLYAETIYQAQPDAWWRLDDAAGEGTAKDFAGSKNGAVQGASPFGDHPAVMPSGEGASAYLDGTMWIDLGNSSLLGPTGSMAVEFWIKPTDDSVRRGLVHRAYGGTLGSTYEPANRVSFYHGTSGSDAGPYQGATGPVPVNEVTHVVLERDNDEGTITIYINGYLGARKQDQHPTAIRGSNSLKIGKGHVADYFKGYIQDVSLYHRALGHQAVIDHLVAGGGEPPFIPEFGIYTLDGAMGGGDEGYNPATIRVPNPDAITRSGRSALQVDPGTLAPAGSFDQIDGSGGSHFSPEGVVSRPDRQGRISGNTTDQNGQPVSRRVRCFERRTGRIVRETWSNAAGYYQFDDLDPGKRFTVVAHDYSGTYNAVIADNAQPEVPA